MLARLDGDLAPFRVSVDRTGSVLRADGPGDTSDLVPRVRAIVEEMGYVAVELDAAPPVERWFGTEAVDLSQEEASVLARRWVDELVAEGLLEDPHRLTEPLTAWLLDAFRQAAHTGEIVAIRIERAALGTVWAGGHLADRKRGDESYARHGEPPCARSRHEARDRIRKGPSGSSCTEGDSEAQAAAESSI